MATTALHVVHLYQTPILEQLKLEEALLRIDQRNWCIINEGSTPAIIMGISGKPKELIQASTWKQAPIPIIRRFSGGGTVAVDENTYFVTFICNTSFISIPPFPDSIMRWTEQLYRPIFAPHPFNLRENDYTLGQHKCGGNAQSICKNRWLHHSTFLWDYSPVYMDYLLLPKKMPAYRQQRSHTEFLCRLKDYWTHKQLLRHKILEHLKAQFTLMEMQKEDLLPLLQVPHRRATQIIEEFE